MLSMIASISKISSHNSRDRDIFPLSGSPLYDSGSASVSVLELLSCVKDDSMVLLYQKGVFVGYQVTNHVILTKFALAFVPTR
jgi:hypothetical protein